MSVYKDVQIRIRGAKAASDGQASVHDVEVQVQGSGLWTGSSTLDLDSFDPSDEEYGKALGAQLANPSVLRALDQAGLTRGDRIRLRLLLDDDATAPHWIRWERLWLPVDGIQWPLAAHPNIAFSRYIPVDRPDEDPPDALSFRLLLAVANPEGLESDRVIDVELELANFLSVFEEGSIDRRLQVSVLPGRTPISAVLKDRIAKQGWSLLAGDATLRGVSKYLHSGFHGLHILAHGGFNPATGIGSLLLEADGGGKALVTDEELQSWITPDLQLVVFQACLSGAAPAEKHPPFTGLAPHMIRLGVPAAVAMQDAVSMTDARVFFFEFYRVLLSDGAVDIAVNRARQVVREQAALDNWSIPALFSRLRGGQLWRADPLRRALSDALQSLPAEPKMPPLPMQAIEHTRGLASYDPVVGGSGPRFDLAKHLHDLVSVPGSSTVLTGGRGFSKAAQLRCLFREFGARFLRGEAGIAMPILLSLPELAGRTSERWPILRRVWSGEASEEDENQIAGRQFLFLLDADEEMAGNARETALEAVRRLSSLAGNSLLLVADEALITSLQGDFDDSTLLVMQPLEWPRVSAYLEALHTDSARVLQKQIREREYIDLVSQPRFLQHMLDLAAHGVPLTSRHRILERICGIYFSKVNTDAVPRGCVESAAQRLAWEIQSSGTSQLAGAELYPILNEARAGRDFSLSELTHALVSESRLLVPSGDEGVRFAYPAMQSYFAAQYLAAAPNRKRLLENITASLGRLSRVRCWEKVLVLLAGILPCPGDLLRMVLAGSPLLEGDQVFIAVRCYQEAVAERKHSCDMDDVIDQMIDSLIWRSSWDDRRTYADRQKALRHLIVLAALYKPRQAEIVPHLIALACDPIPGQSARPNREKYDWAGIRQTAAAGAVRLVEQTTKYIHEQRPELREPVDAWLNFTDDAKAICSLLMRDDPRVSVIAAFALIQSERDEDRQTLISAYNNLSNLDVKWGIVEALGGLESAWIYEHVVDPWISQAGSTDTAPEVRQAHICYLIQATIFATPAALEFLKNCLLTGTPWLQGRALRALAKLQDEDIEEWLRPLCEQILGGAADRIDNHRMNTTDAHIAEVTLQRSALEALCDAGDAGSLDVVRHSRKLYGDNHELRQANFQIAEEMYWRLTGGLDKESFTGAAFQTAQGVN